VPPSTFDHVQKSGSSSLTGLALGMAGDVVIDGDFNIPRSPGKELDVSSFLRLGLSGGCDSEESS